jgi:hypothetical protein
LSCRPFEIRNVKLEKIEWPLRLFPVRSVDDDGYMVFPQQQGMLIPSRFRAPLGEQPLRLSASDL